MAGPTLAFHTEGVRSKAQRRGASDEDVRSYGLVLPIRSMAAARNSRRDSS